MVTLTLIGFFSQKSLSQSEDLKSELTQVQKLIEQGNLNLASYLLEKVSQSGENSYIQAIKANLALAQGDYIRSISIFESLYQQNFGLTERNKENRLALLNNYSQALTERSQIYLALASEELYRRQEFSRAALDDKNHALGLVREAVAQSALSSQQSQIQARLNLGKLDPASFSLEDLEKIKDEIRSLPASNQQVNFWLLLIEIHSSLPLLQEALSIALELNDPLSLTRAWGALAQYYELSGDYKEALTASQQASLAASSISNWEQLAKWQWLSARVYRRLNQPENANVAYRNAVNAVKQLRYSLTGNRVSQALYLDTIEPLLRDFLAFLLNQPSASQETLAEALEILRLGQLSELDNYFGRICEVIVSNEPSLKADTAIIYTILLPQKSYIILRLGNTYHLFELEASSETIKKEALNWRHQIADRFYGDYRPGSYYFYDKLIRPIKPKLALNKISHLIFVQDGILRNLPMAALYDDDKKFLIESFSISYSLGLGGRIVSSRPKSPLVVAASQPSSAFPNPIPAAIDEARNINNLLGGTQLINEAFSPATLLKQLEKPHQLLHIASHSRFSGLIEESLVQTGTQTLTLFEFERILQSRQSPIKRLILSACQTAEGSRYAVLGLAGIGLRSGIDNVIGSLWFSEDKKTSSFITSFYQFWKFNLSEEEALRQAQIEQIRKGTSPIDWAAFVCITP
ncbi:CHAT domain-containing protein [Gloeothece verrucosa]|nr:CHAT domain-containing protein [Gloeothece verrucosa]